MAVETEEIDLTPGSAAWLRVISASKVAAILGVSPWSSPMETWLLMAGKIERENVNTDATRRGHYLEPAILQWWQDRHPGLLEYEEQVTQEVHHDGDFIGIATLDAKAITGDFEHVAVEAKSSSRWDGWGKEGTDEIPVYYWWQTMFQMASDRLLERAYVPVIGPYLDFREYVVERDQATIDGLLVRLQDFLYSLDSDVPPELDSHPATLQAVSRLHLGVTDEETALVASVTAREYVEASLALKDAEARDRLAKSTLLQAAGKAQYVDIELPDGGTKRVARRQQKEGRTPYLVRVMKDLSHFE